MTKEFAWKAFKNTGSISTFLELKQIENIENQNLQKMDNKGWKLNEYYKDERNNNSRK